MRSRPYPKSVRLASGWLGILLLAAVLAPWLPLPWQASQLDAGFVNAPPSGRHWLGTDLYGRDVAAQLVFGAQSLLLVSFSAAGLASLIGVAAGTAAGYWGNNGVQLRYSTAVALGIGVALVASLEPHIGLWLGPVVAIGLGWLLRRLWPTASAVALPLDSLLLAAMLLLGAVPRLALVLALAALPVPRVPLLILLLGLSGWTSTARLVRTEVRRIQALSYVESARVLGLREWHVLVRHVLRNAQAVLLSAVPLNLSACVALQTTLSFLGVGLPPETADWGTLLLSVRQEPGAWWLLAPALALAGTLLALRVVATALLNKKEDKAGIFVTKAPNTSISH